VLAVLLLLALGVLFGPSWLLGPQVPMETIKQRDFVQTVVASGCADTPHRVDVGVQIAGTVSRIHVFEGQTVAAGDTLIELEASELDATAVQAA